MQFLSGIYLAYMFVSIYLLILIILIYFKNRKTLFSSPEMTKEYGISVLIPSFNEEVSIAETIKKVFEIDYQNIIEVLVINDGSTDNSLEIMKSLLPRYKGKLRIINKENSGKADSLNKALKFVKGELVAIVDADSFPSKDVFLKTVGHFDNPQVGATTITCVPRNRSKFFEKIQTIEYKTIAFTRKLLGYVDSIYVTPGTMALYRKKALDDIRGFDKKNMTEDIEATWHLIHNNWLIRMSLNTFVTTNVPSNVMPWFKQRKRWGIGGIQCLNKYKENFMRKKAMLGYFVIPFFSLGLFLGLFAMVLFSYIFLRKFLRYFLLTRYSFSISVPVLTTNELFVTPTVLNYFGIILFVLFLLFTLFIIAIMKDNILEKQNFFNIFFYMIVYSLLKPIVLIAGVSDMVRGKVSWR